jgi:Mg-chelatase subunit ChlD
MRSDLTDGDAVFTLVQFDNEYEFVHRGVPIGEVPKCSLRPRGSTALLDAIGRAINETGIRLQAIAEDQRPGLVVFVVVTDGMENASHEFTHAQINEMIARQESEYQWKFTYLGANQDAFDVGEKMAFTSGGIANYSPRRSKEAFLAAASNVGRMRSATARGEAAQNEYTEEERTSMS